MDYEAYPPTGAILRLHDWFESVCRDEPEHRLLMDIVDECAWPPKISGASWIGDGSAHESIGFDVPKPRTSRPGEDGTQTRIQIDSVGFAILMLYRLAGAEIRKDSRGDGKYHYLVVAFPGEPTIPVHRLIVDAPEDQDAELPDHHDYRRETLGPLATIDAQRERHGVDRVRSDPRTTRQSAAELAVNHLLSSGMDRLVSEKEYRAMLSLAYLFLDDLPLGTAEQ